MHTHVKPLEVLMYKNRPSVALDRPAQPTMLLSLLVAALATLVLASPLPAERAVSTNRRITWRHGDQSEEGRKNLVVCGGGPVVGFGNGNEFLMQVFGRSV